MHLRRVVLAVASELDLGLPELLTLKECDRAAVTPSDLAITLGLSRTGVTDLLDRLESAGWVRRAEHPTDRRATLVELSPEGRRLVRTAKARLRERLSPVRAALSPEGATALREALAQLDRAIERSLGAE